MFHSCLLLKAFMHEVHSSVNLSAEAEERFPSSACSWHADRVDPPGATQIITVLSFTVLALELLVCVQSMGVNGQLAYAYGTLLINSTIYTSAYYSTQPLEQVGQE